MFVFFFPIGTSCVIPRILQTLNMSNKKNKNRNTYISKNLICKKFFTRWFL